MCVCARASERVYVKLIKNRQVVFENQLFEKVLKNSGALNIGRVKRVL